MSSNALRLPTEQEVLAGILEDDFREFITYFFWVQNGLKFKWNSHHDEIVDALIRCYQHQCSRLVINIPPRYSKTELVVIMFIAWCLAKHPMSPSISWVTISCEIGSPAARSRCCSDWRATSRRKK